MQPFVAALRLLELAQVAGVDLAALAHPLRRGALVGDAHLVGGVGQQPPHDRGADRAGAAGDQHAAHARRRAERRELGGVGEHLAGAPAVPGVHHQAVRRPPAAAIAASVRGSRNSEWLAATTTTSAPSTASSKRRRRRRHVRVVHDHVGQLALEQPDQLVGERVALVVGVGLERQPEHGHLAVGERAQPALGALEQEQRHRLVDARDREQHPGRRASAPRRR